MKRFSSSDSLAPAILCISSAKEDEKKTEKSKQMGYSREFQAMLDSLDEEDYIEEAATDHNIIEKKRRLTLEQVKALERDFEVENKLEPERKQRLAEHLGLQPRQVAIWFQNRRARWKSKQLERDYDTLKSSYESLKLDYSSLENENEALTLKLKELKGKFNDSNRSIKEEECYPVVSEQSQSQGWFLDSDHNDGSSANGFMDSWIHVSESRTSFGNQESCQPHPIKVEEEQGVFSSEGSCNFFSVDQPPTLHWYFPPDQR